MEMIWREKGKGIPAMKEKGKKITCWLHLVTAHHALSAHTSIFWSNQADLMVTPNVIFF